MASRYWVGGTATWDASTTSVWSTTSGGSGGASVPTSSDDVYFDQAGTYTVTIGANFTPCAKLTVSATTYTFNSNSILVNGDLFLVSGTVWNQAFVFGGTGSYTLTTNGVSGTQLFCTSGATITLGSALTLTNSLSIASFSNGSTLNTVGYQLTCSSIGQFTTGSRTFNFSNSAVTITASGTPLHLSAATVTSSAGATITFTTTGTLVAIRLGSNNYIPALQFTGASGNSVTIYGGTNTTVQDISCTYVGAKTFNFSSNIIFTKFSLSGTAGNLYTISGGTLSKPTTWYVGANSVNSGGTSTGLTFTAGGGIDYLSFSNVTASIATYTIGATILHDDYNVFATGNAAGSATNSGNVNNIWGTGNSQYGWGQSTTITAVSAAGSITAAQWSALSSRINSIRSHQTGSAVTFKNLVGNSTSNFTAGQPIYAVSNLSSALSTAYTAANTASATTGSMACYSTTQQGSTQTQSQYIVSQREAPTSTDMYYSFTWADANSMRYFFNTGGYLEFAFNMPSSGTIKTESWSTLLAELGTIRFGGLGTAYTGYSGSWSTNANTGLNNVTGTETLWWQKYNDTGIGDYNSNYILCNVYLSGSTLYFHVTANDAAADTVSTSVKDDYIDYPITWTAKIYEAGTSYITKTWGTVTTSTSWTAKTNAVEYIVVAGGGGGGSDSIGCQGGGGGAGGFMNQPWTSLPSALAFYTTAGSYTYTIPTYSNLIISCWGGGGGGGASRQGDNNSTNGSDTTVTIASPHSVTGTMTAGGGVRSYWYTGGGAGGTASSTVSSSTTTNGNAGTSAGGDAPNGGKGGPRGPFNGTAGTIPGGGGGGASGSGVGGLGYGGGSGAYVSRTFSTGDLTPGQTISLSVGSGGSGESATAGLGEYSGAAGAIGGVLISTTMSSTNTGDSGAYYIAAGTTYTITIGAGGAGSTAYNGSPGSNSVFNNVIARGGGDGGGYRGISSGGSGGSGGGAVYTTAAGVGTPGQGNNGGGSNSGNAAGGGGGAGGGGDAPYVVRPRIDVDRPPGAGAPGRRGARDDRVLRPRGHAIPAAGRQRGPPSARRQRAQRRVPGRDHAHGGPAGPGDGGARRLRAS